MKNAKNNMKRGLWQDLDGPSLTITSHIVKTSINSRDPVLLVDPEKEILFCCSFVEVLNDQKQSVSNAF